MMPGDDCGQDCGDGTGVDHLSVKHGLLALLAEAPRHGYQLKTDFERRTGGNWAINIGQVYTTLQRLERDGLVEPVATDGSDTDRHDTDRHDYRITAVGREQLSAWFVTPVVPEGPPRDELTIKVLLAVAASEVDVTDILQRQRTASVEQLQAYTRRKAQSDPQKDLAFLLMLDALIFRTEAEVRWLDAAEARLRDAASKRDAASGAASSREGGQA
jgi:DNA-binding PadR family transcriptional regulator